MRIQNGDCRLNRAMALGVALFLSLAAACTTDKTGLETPDAAMSAYDRARAEYEKVAGAYWQAIADKRRIRNAKRRDQKEVLLDDYVLTHPPVYTGPPKPPEPVSPKGPEPVPKPTPVVAEFLRAADEHYRFVPQRPANELEYKREYARVAAAAGLSRDQIVRIYAFESGGNGKYDVQAGLEYDKPGARAISTALGYNQLLHINSVELLAEKGPQIVEALKAKTSGRTGAAKAALEKKLAILQRMMAVARSVPDTWAEHQALANTPQGLGIHALVLDIDVGPLLQTQKLLDSVQFAQKMGYMQPLTAAELEMMNLTGDSTGLDMVRMPGSFRNQVPTANFFQRAGYERNPVASRNNTVAALLAATDAKMDREIRLQGAQDLAVAYPKQ